MRISLTYCVDVVSVNADRTHSLVFAAVTFRFHAYKCESALIS